ncbi:Zinc finger protein 316 [Camponotus floridanus]|uniref:Zinc finger protein 316 n=2 Tax=Camponotus floridanus TaxID=104421 RepID=E2AEW6_CAMFO|nr:Zinc finger protein 316 [Camponotus floridanus]
MQKKRPRKKDDEILLGREKEECRKIKRSNLTNGKTAMPDPATLDPATPGPATPGPSTSIGGRSSKVSEVISLSDSQNENSDDNSDDNSSPWMNLKNIKKPKCPYCGVKYERRRHLIKHITSTCLMNPDSKANKEAGRFRCHGCGRNYGKDKALRYHQKHECQKWITCPDCGKTMVGTFITERHKQKHCVNKPHPRIQHTKIKQEDSSDEIFIDESSGEL